MRVSEVLGLERSNVDLETGHIRIERQTGRVYGRPGVELVPLKTRTSRRGVVVPAAVYAILRWHEDRQRLERRRAEDSGGWEEHGTVFANPAGKLYYRSQPEDDFRAVTAQLGLVGVTPHTLRHTAATLVQEASTSLKTAQALLGHATERMTLRVYSHRTASSLEAVALTMEQLLGDVSVVQPDDDLTASESTGDTSGDHPGDQAATDTA
jgi:integrase